MNRRSFLSLLAMGAPAAIVAEKVGLIHQVKSYFFAPRGGWTVPDASRIDQLLREHWANPLNANAGTWHNLKRDVWPYMDFTILPGDAMLFANSTDGLKPGSVVEIGSFRSNRFVTKRIAVKTVDRATRTITFAS